MAMARVSNHEHYLLPPFRSRSVPWTDETQPSPTEASGGYHRLTPKATSKKLPKPAQHIRYINTSTSFVRAGWPAGATNLSKLQPSYRTMWLPLMRSPILIAQQLPLAVNGAAGGREGRRGELGWFGGVSKETSDVAIPLMALRPMIVLLLPPFQNLIGVLRRVLCVWKRWLFQ